MCHFSEWIIDIRIGNTSCSIADLNNIFVAVCYKVFVVTEQNNIQTYRLPKITCFKRIIIEHVKLCNLFESVINKDSVFCQSIIVVNLFEESTPHIIVISLNTNSGSSIFSNNQTVFTVIGI